MPKWWCVVPAAGCGTRAGSSCPKQYASLAGRPLIEHTLKRLAAQRHIVGLMVVLSSHDRYWPGLSMLAGKPVLTVSGGDERSDSVLAGLEALPADISADDFVLVHDAARPCVRTSDINRLVEYAGALDGGLLGAPLRDTLKYVNEMGCSVRTQSRQHHWRAFTPQMFRRGKLVAALRDAVCRGIQVSDEAMAMELAGHEPLLVQGVEDNIKVTTAADFALAEFLLTRTA